MAKLDKASAYEAGDCRFESCSERQTFNVLWATQGPNHRRGGRAAEGAPLLREYGLNPIEGSNPSLSAIDSASSIRWMLPCFHAGNVRLYINMAQVTEYVDERGRSPFGRWFDRLDSNAARKVTAVLDRMGRGILVGAKGVGEGVLEYRIDSGPGYRIYLGLDGETLIVLLGGGTKRRQQDDIDAAKALWRDYRRGAQEE